MNNRKPRRERSDFSLSFLDCISCGFGAVILLFVISLGSERLVIIDIRQTLEKLYQERLKELDEIRDENKEVINLIQQEIQEEKDKIQKVHSMQTTLEKIIDRIKKTEFGNEKLLVNLDNIHEIVDAREKEIDIPQNTSELPIGVPVANNHLIFILDTSGSMRDPGTGKIWEFIVTKFEETLKVYPIVDAIQVMDADGNFMIRTSRGQWLPDSSGSRSGIMRAIRNYAHHSQSYPVPGIIRAIRFSKEKDEIDSNRKGGIYIFGDEFTQTAEKVLHRIEQLNPADEEGNRHVTINAVGFPQVIKYERHFTRTGLKFANLMRELTYIHGGAFIGTN